MKNNEEQVLIETDELFECEGRREFRNDWVNKAKNGFNLIIGMNVSETESTVFTDKKDPRKFLEALPPWKNVQSILPQPL